MKNLFRGLVLLLAVAATAPSHSTPIVSTVPALPAKPTETVYVCMSKSSVAYHAHGQCGGLSHCSHELRPMSAEAAQRLGKRPCRRCH